MESGAILLYLADKTGAAARHRQGRLASRRVADDADGQRRPDARPRRTTSCSSTAASPSTRRSATATRRSASRRAEQTPRRRGVSSRATTRSPTSRRGRGSCATNGRASTSRSIRIAGAGTSRSRSGLRCSAGYHVPKQVSPISLACASARMCSGAVPQQPPTMRAPLRDPAARVRR